MSAEVEFSRNSHQSKHSTIAGRPKVTNSRKFLDVHKIENFAERIARTKAKRACQRILGHGAPVIICLFSTSLVFRNDERVLMAGIVLTVIGARLTGFSINFPKIFYKMKY